jgi:tetratricopeptide (TPR) repeat protein/transcriptional regulator with XRE-family HTH domain
MPRRAHPIENHQLKRARHERGWSLQDMADKIDQLVKQRYEIGEQNKYSIIIDGKMLSEWERGTSVPRPSARRILCELFGKTPEQLGFLLDLPPVTRFNLYDPSVPRPFLDPLDFVGRDPLLQHVEDRLCNRENECIVLTALHGLPGVGKTALSIQLVHTPRIQEHFRDGVLWASVGRIPNVQGTLLRWGELLGLSTAEMTKLTSRQALIQVIRTAIGERRMLLVLDDIWEAQEMEALQQAGGPSCSYLITTRWFPLAKHFGEEKVVLVEELDEEQGLKLLKRFIDITAEEEGDARALVRAVGGLPLALRLMGSYLLTSKWAKRRTRFLTALNHLQQAEVRLMEIEEKQGFQRHSSLPEGVAISLAAVIRLSEEVLSDDARQALWALSAFPSKPNTFSHEAALAVAAKSDEVLQRLSDAKLIEMSSQERYTLHQTIADYASLKRPDTSAEKRMAKYFAEHVSNTSERVLEIDEVNIERALTAMHQHGQHELLIQLCVGMQNFWRNGGRREASQKHLPKAIAAAEALALRTGQRQDRLIRAELAYAYGQTFFQMGRSDQAEQWFQTSLTIRQAEGDRQAEGVVFSALARVSLSKGQMGKAEWYTLQALTIHRELGARNEEGVDLSTLGQVALRRRQLAAAEEYCQAALLIRREVGNRRGERIDLTSLSEIALDRGQLTKAEEYSKKALSLSREAETLDRRGEAASLRNLGYIALLVGNRLKTLENALHQVLSTFQQVLAFRVDEEMLSLLLHQAEKQYDTAEEYLHQALSIHHAMEDPEGEGGTLSHLAALAEVHGQMEQAESLYRESLTLFEKAQLGRHIADVQLTLGRFLIEQRGNQEEGCSMLSQAIQRYATMGLYTVEMELPSEQKAREVAHRLGCHE